MPSEWIKSQEKIMFFKNSNLFDVFKIVGVGSGSTIVYAVQRLAAREKEEGLNIRYNLFCRTFGQEMIIFYN